VNRDYASAMHVDKNNLGPSAIVGLGDYHGGRLWGQDIGEVDIQGRWCTFDGNIPHCTRPFTGTRYSLIFYTQQARATFLPQSFAPTFCRGPRVRAAAIMVRPALYLDHNIMLCCGPPWVPPRPAQSYAKLQRADKAFLSSTLGYPLPKPGLSKVRTALRDPRSNEVQW
jgi:hypothetical protein